MTTIKLQQKAKGRHPTFFDDPAIDRLVAIITALAGEVTVLHDQVDTITRLLDQKGTVTSDEMNSFVPDGAAEAARDQWRETFLENVFRIIHQEREAMQEGRETSKSYKDIVGDVTKS